MRGRVGAAGPGAVFSGCAPRGPVSAEEPVEVSGNHLLRARLAENRKASRRSAAAWESLPLFLSQPDPRARAAPPGAHQNPAGDAAGESAAAAVAAFPAAQRSRPRDRLEEQGGAKGEASPPTGTAAFSSHSAPPLLPPRQPMGARLGGR